MRRSACTAWQAILAFMGMAVASLAVCADAPTRVIDLATPDVGFATRIAITDGDALPGNEVAISGMQGFRQPDGTLRGSGYIAIVALVDQELAMRYLLRPGGTAVASVASVPAANGPNGLVVLLSDGLLVEYTGIPLRESRRRRLPGVAGPPFASRTGSLWIGDLDGAVGLDALVEYDGMLAMRLDDAAVLWRGDSGLSPLVVGAGNGAPASIVVANFPGAVIDGATGAPREILDDQVAPPMIALRRRAEPRTAFVTMTEGAGTAGGSGMVLRRGAPAQRAWSLDTAAGGLAVADADGDGDDELVVLSEGFAVRVLDATDGRLVRTLDALGVGPAVGGPIGPDATPMVLFDGTIPESGQLNALVAAAIDGSPPRQLKPRPGPFQVAGFDDFDGDGVSDVLVVSPGHRDRGSVEWRSTTDGRRLGSRGFDQLDGGFDALSPMRVDQADSDPGLELHGFSIGGSTVSASTIDLAGWRRETSGASVPVSICESRSALALGGAPAVRRLALGTRLFCPAGSGRVRVFELPGLAPAWSVPMPAVLGTEVVDLVGVQADSDGPPEWVLSGSLGFGLLDDDGTVRWTRIAATRGVAAAGSGADGLRIASIDGDGRLHLWSASGVEQGESRFVSADAHRLVAANADGEWYLVCEATTLAMVRARDGLLLRSAPFGDGACAAGAPQVAPASGPGVVVGAAGSATALAIARFDLDALFADGFE